MGTLYWSVLVYVLGFWYLYIIVLDCTASIYLNH